MPRPSPTIADARQLDFLAAYPAPAPVPLGPGALGCGDLVARTLADAIARSGQPRADIAARMSDLTGERITVPVINAWSAQSHARHRIPFQQVAAFEAATDTTALTALLAGQRGCLLLHGEDARTAELGLVRLQLARLRQRERALLGSAA